MIVQSKTEHNRRLQPRVRVSRSFGSTIGICFVALILFVYFLSIAYPLFWMLMSSLKNTMEMYTSAWAMPEKWLFSNYKSAWKMGVSSFFMNSVILTVLTVMITVAVSSLSAYALTRFQYKGREFILLLFASGLVFSPQVSLIPLYGLIQDLGIYNTYWSLVLPYAAFRMPIIILLMRAFFLGIPKDYAESASLDGCTSWGIFHKIYLPISRPIMFTGGLLTAYFAWNEFMFANIFIDDEKLKPITSGLFVFKDALRTDWGPLIAGLTISAFPLVILFIFIQKQFVRGLAEGGLKG